MGILDGILTGYTNAVLGTAPTDVGGAYAKLQTELNSKYEKAKQAFEADPNNQGKQYQMPDALQRWNDQIQGMMTSGDTTLQKEALSQMVQYHKRATENQASSAPTSLKEYQALVAEGYKGSYEDYLAAKQSRGGTNVNVSLAQGEKWVPLDDLAKFTLPDGSPIPPGTTYSQLQGMGAIPIQSDTQRQAGTAGDVLEQNIQQLGENLDAASETPMAGVLAEARTQPGIVGTLMDVGLNLAGKPMKTSEVEFSNRKTSIMQQTVKLMSGASATEMEMNTYRSMLPKFTDPPAVRAVKYKQAQEFADKVIARNKAAGVQPSKTKANATVTTVDRELDKAAKTVPQQRTSSNGYKYTVSD